MLFGGAGLGKTQSLRGALAGRGCYIEGNATPFGIYQAAFEHADEPLILDDVDGLYRSQAGIRLLKSLCQTQPIKTIRWHSALTAGSRQTIPRNFRTRSRVAIVGNQWKSLSLDVAALEDRGHAIFFDPSAVEVHRKAAIWFRDQQVFDFIRDVLHLIVAPSLRLYVRAAELRAAGLDWRSIVLNRCLSGTALDVARIKTDPNFSSAEERAREFMRRGLGCRATYFNFARRITPAEDMPHIVLTTKTSPAERVAAQELSKPTILEILRKRQGGFGKN